MGDAFLTEDDSDACWICPALRLPAGQFDVYERPTRDCPFDPSSGFRYAGDIPVCVHPYKVGLPPGHYASAGTVLPDPAPHPRAPERVQAQPVPVRAYPGPAPRPAAVPQADDAAIMAGARPAVPDELLSWMRGLVADAAPGDLADTLGQAEEAALLRFSAESVVEALRRVLGGG